MNNVIKYLLDGGIIICCLLEMYNNVILSIID